jgi:hypothetical protein
MALKAKAFRIIRLYDTQGASPRGNAPPGDRDPDTQRSELRLRRYTC